MNRQMMHGLEADSDCGLGGRREMGEEFRGGGGGVEGENLDVGRCGCCCSWLARGPQGGSGYKTPW